MSSWQILTETILDEKLTLHIKGRTNITKMECVGYTTVSHHQMLWRKITSQTHIHETNANIQNASISLNIHTRIVVSLEWRFVPNFIFVEIFLYISENLLYLALQSAK